jgi:hypothetical protein
MDELEKSHEETKIFCRLTPTLIQPAMSAVKITYDIRNLLLCGPSKVYAIVLEFGPGEWSDHADWHPGLPCRGS